MTVSRETCKAEHFFDLKEIWFKELFGLKPYPWELLEKGFKEKWIESKIKPNLQGIIREGNLVLKSFSVNGGKIEAGAYIQGDLIELREEVTIEAGSWVAGPTILGPKSEVRHNAYIRGGVITGAKALIGHASEVKSSIFLNEAKAPHFAYVGDSILGNGVNLGAGTKVSNLKITSGDIRLKIEEETVPTGIRKIGAIVGDKTETGCNSVLNPGTLLGKHCLIYPAVSVPARYYPKRAEIK